MIEKRTRGAALAWTLGMLAGCNTGGSIQELEEVGGSEAARHDASTTTAGAPASVRDAGADAAVAPASEAGAVGDSSTPVADSSLPTIADGGRTLDAAIDASSEGVDASFLTACSPIQSSVDGAAALRPKGNEFGRQTVCSTLDVSEAVDTLAEALADAGLGVPVSLDHQAAAVAVGLELGASHLFVFGNPALGTPMMQEQPLLGLDLPLKLLIFEDSDGSTQLTYDSPDALRRRYALTSVETQLQQVTGALARFAGVAAGLEVQGAEGEATSVGSQDGVVVVASTQDGPSTLADLLTAIDENPRLSVLTTVDHRAAAESISQPLGFSTLVVFGSAEVGTPLMQSQPSVGLDLPLKILVAEVDDSIVLAYSAPSFVAERHAGLPGQSMLLGTMAGVLDSLTATAAGTVETSGD